MTNKIKIGIIGCGNISPRYFEACKRMQVLELVGCADMMLERAQARAKEYNTQVFTVDELIAHPDIQIVINLTIPNAHGEIGTARGQCGQERRQREAARGRRASRRAELLDTAKAKGVLVGGAPDTFMGAGLQPAASCWTKAVIGKPIAATAWMLSGGPEPWHPDPEFFYALGGGPMFDMGRQLRLPLS